MNAVQTERLHLEPVTTKNARELWTVLNAPDLRRFQDIPRVRAEEFERQVRARPRALNGRSTGRFEWLIRRSDTNAAVGWISLRINDRTPHIGELGYSLIEEARGFGFASEALLGVIYEAFDGGDLGEVQACCVPQNSASRRVLERTNFREERLIRSGAVIRGRPVDVVLFAQTRAEWTRYRLSSPNSMVMPASAKPK